MKTRVLVVVVIFLDVATDQSEVLLAHRTAVVEPSPHDQGQQALCRLGIEVLVAFGIVTELHCLGNFQVRS